MLQKEKWKFKLKDIRLFVVAALIALFSLYYTEGKALSQEVIYDATLVEDGIAYGELSIGVPNAPVTVIEYASVTCPHCATFHKEIFLKLKPDYIDTGKVKFIMRNIIPSHYDMAAVMQARCLGPKKAWDVMDRMFSEHEWTHGDIFKNLREMLADFGVNNEAFDACFKQSDLQASLVEVMTGPAQQDQVSGTPTIFINGERFEGGRTYLNISTKIEEALGGN